MKASTRVIAALHGSPPDGDERTGNPLVDYLTGHLEKQERNARLER